MSALSAPTKRKFTNNTFSNSIWYLIKYEGLLEYSVIKAAQIKISKNDGDRGTVIHKNKSYKVAILNRGVESVVRAKALKYQAHGTDFEETESESRPKRNRIGLKFSNLFLDVFS